ncbi:DUF4249 domain-containing protein [Psychroserpens ponticola]|uniref:DUF4249 domain-containing protein n=1 Tax=Psychroserpens ponticola TaxID=2932268 RepID=A0ABY7S0E0_9FLAO|nr:DUF4249 domain-containing protein [Psychroserpens ponticola]WCO02593.1 DUF4249 domain-containing protein [Psychroserpens ponticola]
MNIIHKYICPFLITTLLLNSCTDVIDVNVPNGGARLVVEAFINWEKGTTGQNQVIKLSTSTAFFDSNPDIPAIGADVKVTNDNDGTEFIFQDQGNGRYITNDFIPELNQIYLLEIIYNGKTYSATETLIPVVDISEVEQSISEEDGDENIKVTIFFDDPANEANYYLGEFIPSFNSQIDFFPLSDNFTDGNQNFMEFSDADFIAGNTLSISLYGISEHYYNFFDLLLIQSESDGNGPFQTTPVQLKGNCKNLADPNEEVLGYFRLSEVVRTTYTIN